jgi:hypothetical protein
MGTFLVVEYHETYVQRTNIFSKSGFPLNEAFYSGSFRGTEMAAQTLMEA